MHCQQPSLGHGHEPNAATVGRLGRFRQLRTGGTIRALPLGAGNVQKVHRLGQLAEPSREIAEIRFSGLRWYPFPTGTPTPLPHVGWPSG